MRDLRKDLEDMWNLAASQVRTLSDSTAFSPNVKSDLLAAAWLPLVEISKLRVAQSTGLPSPELVTALSDAITKMDASGLNNPNTPRSQSPAV